MDVITSNVTGEQSYPQVCTRLVVGRNECWHYCGKRLAKCELGKGTYRWHLAPVCCTDDRTEDVTHWRWLVADGKATNCLPTRLLSNCSFAQIMKQPCQQGDETMEIFKYNEKSKKNSIVKCDQHQDALEKLCANKILLTFSFV